jgi:hypothetical protein
MSAKPAREGAGNVLHYDSDGARTMAARRNATSRAETPARNSALKPQPRTRLWPQAQMRTPLHEQPGTQARQLGQLGKQQ